MVNIMMSRYPLFSTERLIETHPSMTQKTLLKELAGCLYRAGLVKESFCENVILREAQYPTGIVMESHSIAIPHTEFEHVDHTGFAVALNYAGIPFQRADVPEQAIVPEIIVMMAIDQHCEKIAIIQSLFALLASQQSVETICKSMPEKVISIFTDAVKTR